MKIHRAEHYHRDAIKRILIDTNVFNNVEINCALELFDLATIPEIPSTDYIIYCIFGNSNDPLGYICYGPTPLTDGTYDIYWIAVKPKYQGNGIGKSLLHFVESEIWNKGGRLIIVETSSEDMYSSTRQFYLKNHYTLEYMMHDFYATGNHRCIYTKRRSDSY